MIVFAGIGFGGSYEGDMLRILGAGNVHKTQISPAFDKALFPAVPSMSTVLQIRYPCFNYRYYLLKMQFLVVSCTTTARNIYIYNWFLANHKH